MIHCSRSHPRHVAITRQTYSLRFFSSSAAPSTSASSSSSTASASALGSLQLSPPNDLLQFSRIPSRLTTDDLAAALLPRSSTIASPGPSIDLLQAARLVQLVRDRDMVREWLESGAQEVTPGIMEGLNRLIAIVRMLVAQAAGPAALSRELLEDPSMLLPAAADVLLGPAATAAASSSAAPLLQWCGPLALSTGGAASPAAAISTLKQELGVLCFILGAATRQLALSKVGVGPGICGDSADGGAAVLPASARSAASADPAAQQAEAVALLRQAAGMFQYAKDKVLAGLPEELQLRSLELQPSVAQLLSTMCLAEAQAVVTLRASSKGSANATLASLEAGCARLFGSAEKLAREVGVAPAPGFRLPFGMSLPQLGGGGSGNSSRSASGGDASGSGGGGGGGQAAGPKLQLARQLGSYLAASEAFHLACTLQLQGQVMFDASEMGAATLLYTDAEAALQRAADVAKGPGGRPRGPAWPAAWALQLQARLQAVAALKAESEKERLGVTLQPLPRERPPAPEPKVLVAVTPFVPGLPPTTL